MSIRTIHARGEVLRDEGLASGTVLPGMLVELTSAAADTYRAHNAAGGSVAPVIVAVEDDLQGNGVADAYASGARLQVNTYRSGDRFIGRVNDGETITKGMKVESAGNGKLRAYVEDSAGVAEDPLSVIGVAEETVDMSDSSGADPDGFIRIRVR